MRRIIARRLIRGPLASPGVTVITQIKIREKRNDMGINLPMWKGKRGMVYALYSCIAVFVVIVLRAGIV